MLDMQFERELGF